jgi:hypothetical protein
MATIGFSARLWGKSPASATEYPEQCAIGEFMPPINDGADD